jgi:hypothetical protein
MFASASDLSLPPPFSLVTLREAGDAFRHAIAIAPDAGAGTLVWARRFDLAEFAVVLEPEEPLRLARRAVYAGANALADTLAALAPPERAIAWDWPDADWIVFAAMVRTVVMQAGEPGLRPLLGGLDEQGFEELSPSAVIEDWARYFLRETDRWNEFGFHAARARWLARVAGEAPRILDNGDAGSRSLAAALKHPSWLDPATGVPWI